MPEGSYKFVVNATDIYGYEKSLQSTSFKVDKVVVYFGSNVDRDIVSSYSIGVIKDVMLASGVKYCTITSTIRTPEDQASAMYRNCKKTGVDYQLRLYGNAGDQVICVYRDNYEESSDKIKELMADKIRELWKKDIIVSKHCVSPESYAKRNVIDIGYASIVAQGKNQAFRSALSSNGSISKYIDEPNNSCHHIEIAQ